jgi:SAM-dependent methyltransferase
MPDFDTLIAEAAAQPFSGWDFSWLAGRWEEPYPPWHYRRLVVEALNAARSLLDMGTGGGEFLATLPNRPADTVATEGYPPNVPVARARLEPLGVQVVAIDSDESLPFDAQRFDLIINRHEAFHPAEVFRLLIPGGRFITQQVGGMDNWQVNHILQDPVVMPYPEWNGPVAVRGLIDAGFRLVTAEDAFPPLRFFDVGALVYWLRAIPWQVPGFSIETHREPLRRIHDIIEREGLFESHSHRFIVVAEKPDSNPS